MKPIDYYEEGDNTEERRFLFERERKSLSIILKYLHSNNKEGINFLDIGCGDGYFLNSLSSSYNGKLFQLGIDYSVYQIKQVKNRSINVSLSQVNLEEGIPCTNCSFDIVYAGEVIEHLFNPDVFVREVYRILKIDGIFVISTPNINNWLSRLIFPLGSYPVFYETSTENSKFGYGFLKTIKKQSLPVGHVRVMNVDALNSLLITNNFQAVETQGCVFERYSGMLGFLDKLFTFRATFSSGLVVSAKKTHIKN